MFSICPAPLPPGQDRFKQFPTPGSKGLDLSPRLPGGGMVTDKIEPCITACFYRGKYGPFASRAPSWIFKTRGPGDERASAKIEGGGRGREEKNRVLSFFLFAPPAPLPPRRLFVNYRSPRSSASRIFQNGGQESELRVFSPKKNSNAYR